MLSIPCLPGCVWCFESISSYAGSADIYEDGEDSEFSSCLAGCPWEESKNGCRAATTPQRHYSTPYTVLDTVLDLSGC